MSFKDTETEESANLSCDVRVIVARSNVTFLNCGATMCKISSCLSFLISFSFLFEIN